MKKKKKRKTPTWYLVHTNAKKNTCIQYGRCGFLAQVRVELENKSDEKIIKNKAMYFFEMSVLFKTDELKYLYDTRGSYRWVDV